jgi:hypothetical protein
LFGSGGGVTGTAIVFKMTRSGEVFKGKGIAEIEYSECGKIKKSVARKLIARVAESMESPAFQHPGNMYYFLTLADSEGEKKVTWGDPGYPAPQKIKTLYDEINAAIVDVRFKPIR